MAKRVLPHTAWMADSQWALQAKPIAVLMVALTLFGSGEGMVVLASLGSTPWTVLAQGLSLNSGLSDWLATGRYRGIRDSAICRRRGLGRPNYATVYHRALRVSLGVN